jgi:hypothetical protein
MPLEIPGKQLSDAEIAAVLRDSIAGSGRYSRLIDLQFAALCAEHLVTSLRLAGLIVVQPQTLRLTD